MFLRLDDVSMADEIVKLHYCSDRDSLATRSTKDKCSTGDQTIILGLQIFLDQRSSTTIDQKLRWDGMGWSSLVNGLLRAPSLVISYEKRKGEKRKQTKQEKSIPGRDNEH